MTFTPTTLPTTKPSVAPTHLPTVKPTLRPTDSHSVRTLNNDIDVLLLILFECSLDLLNDYIT